MNKQMYKLVFSRRLGMLVPAAEVVRSHGSKSSGSRLRGRRRLLAALLTATAVPAMAAPGGLIPDAVRGWTNAAIANTTASSMTIRQMAPKAYLNWQKLNLNAGETLTFDQQGNRNWAALNRIYDQAPSVIAGQVNADGHLYFINANGIVFANGAQINVGSLTAGSLDVTDALFEKGIVTDPSSYVFSGTGGFVQVEGGAHISTASGGRVMLLAPDVTNSGVINTPDGQTILAAGKQVYLTDSKDPAGLLVEVNSGGTATNLGDIVAQRGNVTLVGLAVNQQNRISASTSVRANGSIHLLARDTVTIDPTTKQAQATRGGVLNVGQGSRTVIEVETADTEEVLDAQTLNPSRVKMSGGVISVDGSIVAHGGQVQAVAAFNPSLIGDQATVASAVSSSRIVLGDSALIDVSGVDASAPMSRHQLKIQLFSDQLKDAPILRDSDLFGQTVYIDARKDTALVDIAPLEAQTSKTIAERLSAGGTVELNATRGDVLMAQGATVDVSGGGITYESGFVRESSLRYNGKEVPISEADKNIRYEGVTDVASVTNKKFNVSRSWALRFGGKGTYYESYTEGSDAGRVDVTAGHAVLGGTFNAVAHASPAAQRAESVPMGGTFNFLIPAGNTGITPAIHIVDTLTEWLAENFSAVGTLDANTQKFGAGDSLTAGLEARTELTTGLMENGFNQINVTSNSGSAITVNAAMDVHPGGSLVMTTLGDVTINRDIVTSGGDLTINGGNIVVADGVTLSTAGVFTNDSVGVPGALTAPVAVDGGNLALSAVGTTTLGENSKIDASAGAWMQSSGKLKGGKGGDVTLVGIEELVADKVTSYGFSKGGNLAISTQLDVQIGGLPPASGGTFWLNEEFFSHGGFSGYDITSAMVDNTVTVGGGQSTTILPQMMTLQAKSGMRALQSGSSMHDVAEHALLPDALRAPASISLTSNGALTVMENATIRTDTPMIGDSIGGSISLSSTGQMTIQGDLIAPAGSISAAVTGQLEGYQYDNTLSLYVGDHAKLSATGAYVVAPSTAGGLVDAAVLDAGEISLDGGNRAVVVLKEGSLLDVSGVSGAVDIDGTRGLSREVQHGAAGNITVSARNGITMDGELRGAASGTGRDGTLMMTLTGGDDSNSGKGHPNGARVIRVSQENMRNAAGVTQGGSVAGITGAAAISVDQLADGGFGSLTLGVDRGVAGDRIIVSEGLDMHIPDKLVMNASLLEVEGSASARLGAAYVQMNGKNAVAASGGNASLNVDAEFIDLVGNVAISGVDKTTLSAQHDIRGRGTKAGTAALFAGSLMAPGDLALIARQIYPVTNSRFQFEATGAGSRIEVQSSVNTPGTLLSAGGVLTLKAEDIVQGGVLRAPLGQINFEASNSLTLKNGSLTSVSLNGAMVPYGLTRLGGLDMLEPNENLRASENATAMSALPTKKVNLAAANVALEEGATLDISGGGDTFAYEWIEGIGGSKDILNQQGVYAVLPSLQNDFAPFDYNYQIGSDLQVGDAVYLPGVAGLAAGTYTLLPARYALMPGAFMVQTSNESLSMGASVAQPDGSALVSGYRTTMHGASRDASYSAFRVTNGSVFYPAEGEFSKAASEYRISRGNAFFAALATKEGREIARSASDAGQLVLNASDSLSLGARLLTGKASGARGALMDIVSDRISVVSEIGQDDGLGTLQLTASALNGLGVESLMLGGTRTQGGDGVTLTTGATVVSFANDDEHALEVSELLAVASNTLSVEEGASIQTGMAQQTVGSEALRVTGDGALLAVSSLNDLELARSGTSGNIGVMNVGQGATVQAGRSVVLDSTKAAELAGNVDVGVGGSATLGANRILLGSPAAVDGLHVDNALLADLGDLAKVTLSSTQNLEIHGGVSLGNTDLDLTINSSGIKGVMTGDEAVDLVARTFTMKNSTGISATADMADGTLNISANNMVFSGGDHDANAATAFGIGGFSVVNLATDGEIRTEGVGATQINAGTTHIESARITGATGADYALKANGVLTASMAANAAALPEAHGLGARLALQAAAMTLSGKVALPSGQFSARAITGNLTLGSGAEIQAASMPVSFGDQVAYSPGGKVTLQADAGSVNVNAGVLVNVNGAGDADAGTLKLSARNGMVTIDGTLTGAAGSGGGESGRVEVDVATLADFGAVNDKLNAGEFAQSREFRVRTGNLGIAADDTIRARQVTISTDAGALAVAGAIDASSDKDAMVALYGGTGVTLSSTAHINASNTSADEAGGLVEIATSSGYLDLQSGSRIDVRGGTNGDGGEVRLRAPRTADNKDIQITSVASTIDGASLIQAEGFKSYTDNNIATADFSTTGTATSWYKEAETFLKSALVNSSYGLGRLGKSGDNLFTIVPGLEIRNTTGDVTLSNDWSLHNWRFDRDSGAGVTTAANLVSGLDSDGRELLSGVLTLRASGNLNINNTLSDGFSSATLTTANTAQGLNAWSYNLIAGSDFGAANYREVNSNGAGNITLASGKGIRTGAGGIAIAAGGNLDLTTGNESSVIYTAGRKAEALPGFTVPTNALYLTEGGDINIDVAGNIIGKIGANGAQQLINHWLFRQSGGSNNKQASWWVRPDLFKQGVATFGGGDVTIRAGGDVTNFSASAATTARYLDADHFVLNGGGDVTVSAGQDINSGIYFSGQGNVRIDAGGAVQASSNTFGTTIALMDASADVSAVRDATVETVFNPTMWAQVTSNAATFDQTGNNAYFLTYAEDSAFGLSSLTGNIGLGMVNSGRIISDLVAGSNNTGTAKDALEIHPGTVRAVAFGGDVNLGRFVMSPATTGDLRLLSAGDVSGSLIAMSDADVSLLPGISNPVSQSAGLETAINQFRFVKDKNGENKVSHAATPVHAGDDRPVVIVADTGSIALTGVSTADKYAGAGLLSPKAVSLYAGKDVTLDADIQHVSGGDISVVHAGRDFNLPADPGSIVQLGGPGELLLKAGRNVTLGTTRGIVTVANTVNPALSDEGASVTVMAGVGKQGGDLAAYIGKYIDPAGSGSSTLTADEAALLEFISNSTDDERSGEARQLLEAKVLGYKSATADALAGYVRKVTNSPGLTNEQAFARFQALNKHLQEVFVYRHFSSELLASGETSGFSDKNINRGDEAIATLFPSARSYDGDLSLFKSQIRTLRNGSIDLLVPGGFVNAGVPTSSGSDIGIVTEFGGDIRAFAETGFQVEQSKVITQYGTDVTIWVNNGDIDAGRGSKSAISVPERVVSTDADGNTKVEVKGVAAGSGIRSQTYDPDGPAGPMEAPELENGGGTVTLIAPRGRLNLGEAGIGGGRVKIVAPVTTGPGGIESGNVSGAPPADTGSLAAVAGVGNLGADATKSASDDVTRQAAQSAAAAFSAKNFLPSFVSVEVIGLGY